MNKAIKPFGVGRMIRHAAELLQVARTFLRHRIFVKGNTSKSEVTKPYSALATRIDCFCEVVESLVTNWISGQ
jgi:hypothetical protein